MPERLLKRDGTYYFRAVYPADVRHLFRARERWKSLRTKDLAEARVRVRVESLRFDAEMAELRRRRDEPPKTALSRAEVDQIAATYLHELMAEDEGMRVEGLTRSEYRSADDTVAIVLPDAKGDAAIGHVEPYRDEFDDWLVSNGLRLDPAAPVPESSAGRERRVSDEELAKMLEVGQTLDPILPLIIRFCDGHIRACSTPGDGQSP